MLVDDPTKSASSDSISAMVSPASSSLFPLSSIPAVTVDETPPVHTHNTRMTKGVFKLNPCYALTVASSIVVVPLSAKHVLLVLTWKATMLEEFQECRRMAPGNFFLISSDDML